MAGADLPQRAPLVRPPPAGPARGGGAAAARGRALSEVRRRPGSAREVLPQILRTIGATEGFSLIPVEVPGPDVARALGRWLGENGHPVRIVAPSGDDEWRTLPSRLLRTETGPYGAALVIGPPVVTAGVREGLFLLNQRRDIVIRALDAPLLWCGSAEFLRETWRGAPDFWSVRSLTWRIGPRAARPAPTLPWSGPLVADEPAQLAALVEEARRQGDPLNAARMGYLQAAALAARSDPQGAREVLARALADAPPGDADLAFDLHVLDARLAMLTGESRVVDRRLREARRLAGDSPGKRAQLDLIVARRFLKRGKVARAEALLQDVATRCRSERPFLAARALTALGRILRRGREPQRLDAAEAALREALDLFQSLGEALGAANVLAELGDLARQRGRSSEAVTLYRGALDGYRAHGARDGAVRVRRKMQLAERSLARLG